MTGAAESLSAAALGALRSVAGLTGAYDGPPLQAAYPYAMLEIGPEADWGHKTGVGRELRFAVTIRDQGEKPDRLRRLMREVEVAVAVASDAEGGWRIVSLTFLRSRVVRDAGHWTGVSDFRARMLSE